MPRGEMLHTKLKREILKAEPTAYAVELAKERIRISRHAKPWTKDKLIASFTEHVGKFLDKIDVDGVLKIGAVLSLTYLIKPLIHTDNEVQARINILKASQKLGARIATVGTYVAEPFATIAEWVVSAVAGDAAFTEEQKEQVRNELKGRDVEEWLLAFATAVIIVVFGTALLEGGGMLGLARALVGA